MAEPASVPTQAMDLGLNTVYFPPREGGPPDCGSLPVVISDVDTDCPKIHSFWKPTEEELEALNWGGWIKLTVWGGQPPVAVTCGGGTK